MENRERGVWGRLGTPCLNCNHDRTWHRDYQAECYLDDCDCRAYQAGTS